MNVFYFNFQSGCQKVTCFRLPTGFATVVGGSVALRTALLWTAFRLRLYIIDLFANFVIIVSNQSLHTSHHILSSSWPSFPRVCTFPYIVKVRKFVSTVTVITIYSLLLLTYCLFDAPLFFSELAVQYS